MPKLEDLHKEAVKKFGEEPLTGAAEQRYRRVLGQLAWAALSRADLSFPISFLSRFQAKPNPAAEHCMRTFLGEMGLRMFNDAKAAISMGKMDGLLRRVRHLELRVKYCQHLHKTRKLSITHWKGEENPSDGVTRRWHNGGLRLLQHQQRAVV